MSIRYGQKITTLGSRKSSFFKKNRFDASVIKRPRNVSTPSTNTWTRPADWLTMPTITSSEQKIALLMPVFPQGSNFLAFTITLASGQYTVDWGDGIVEDVNSAVKAQHAYDFTNANLNATVTADGYKMAIVTIIPKSGQNLTGVNFNQLYAITGSTFPASSPILEIILSCPNLTSLSLGSNNTASAYCKSLVHFSGVNMGTITSYVALFYNITALKQVSTLYTTATITSTVTMYQNCRALISVPLFNTASVTVMNSMFSACNSLVSVPFFNTVSVTSMNSMFVGCNSLVSIPLFDTSKVITMDGTFQNCASLVTIPAFNTPLLTLTSNMFNGCTSLVSVPLFDTSKVVNMNNMFSGCRSLATVPIFNTSSCVNMSLMFINCSILTSVPLFDTSKVTTMGSMFYNCFVLSTVPLFDTSKVTDMNQMFRGCAALSSVPFFNTALVTSMFYMFAGCAILTTIPLFNTSNVLSMGQMFGGCSSLSTVPLFDTSKVTSMILMFWTCSSLTSVPLFDTSKVTDMSGMFNGCTALFTVPLFNTSNVLTMSQMFVNCTSLITVPWFDTSKVTSMSSMFSSCLCLITVPVFTTVNVVNMGGMFNGCLALTSVPQFDTSKVIDMSSMFINCAALVSVPQWNTPVNTSFAQTFNGCTSLASVPLLNASTVSSVNFTNTFNGCISLTRGALSGTRFTISYAGCKLSKEELESVFNNLGPMTIGSETLTISNNWGAPSVVGSLAATTTANSTTITMTNTAGLAIGMQVTGTNSPLTTVRAVTFNIGSVDIISIANHGLSDGDEVSFASTGSITSITAHTIYYVVNSTADTFKIAASVGGQVITWPARLSTSNGSIRHRTAIVSITPNTSIVVSRPMAAGGATTLTFRQLKTGTALLKGWTVVG